MDTVQQAELATIARLAGKARKEGVQLLHDRRDGRYYASSATTPGQRYYVTLVSCTCPGFFHHQRCKHWAALHVALILQDGGPAPSEELCPTCHGAGTVKQERSRWISGSTLGYRDEWTTDVPCPACTPPLAA